jgi:hypothetical protein
MKRLLLLAATMLVASTVYAAAPFVTAWNIREAVKSGDAEYLAGTIDWPRVKETLRTSLAAAALDTPAEASAADLPAPKPSLWQRFKSWVGRGAVDRMVDTYANAEGLPTLFAYRKSWRDVTGHVEETKTLANLPERLQRAWSRVRRAAFTSPTRFEMEMVDKNDPDRSFAGTLELTASGWKLVSLHVHQQKPQSLTGSSVSPPGSLFSRLRAAAAPRLASPRLAVRGGDPMER